MRTHTLGPRGGQMGKCALRNALQRTSMAVQHGLLPRPSWKAGRHEQSCWKCWGMEEKKETGSCEKRKKRARCLTPNHLASAEREKTVIPPRPSCSIARLIP